MRRWLTNLRQAFGWFFEGGPYIMGEEEDGLFDRAEIVYRRLKRRYSELGSYDVAGHFFYREMEMKRKRAPWRRGFGLRLWLEVTRASCGYGERPERAVAWAIGIVCGLAVFYYAVGGLVCGLVYPDFWQCLYFSAVSFTALGYGPWLQASDFRGWAQGLGVSESFMGVFMMALFLVTFTRKMTR